MSDYKFKRVLLKLSGEALMGSKEFGIDPDVPQKIAEELKPAYDAGMQIAVVVGGGNIFRVSLARPQAWIGPRATTWACSRP